jgi:oxygen-independent coproporphyrinogen-3 oxidase
MERLTEMDLLNEYIMTHLRLDVGISAEAIKGRWGTDQVQRIESKMVGYEQLEKVVKTTEGWKLTDNGKFFADGIAADLFWV